MGGPGWRRRSAETTSSVGWTGGSLQEGGTSTAKSPFLDKSGNAGTQANREEHQREDPGQSDCVVCHACQLPEPKGRL